MIELEEAIDRLAAVVEPAGEEEVGLGAAQGRVLAEPVLADRDFPPGDRSAMDGFAVRSADLTADGERLRLAGEVRAGRAAPDEPLAPGSAVRIYTGAVIPPGADAVVMVERTRSEGGEVVVEQRPHAGDHIRRQGEELRAGATVLEPGTLIRSPELAALASVGRTRIRVHRRLVSHVLATGDELVAAGETPACHQLRNSNSPMLIARLAEAGLAARDLGIVRDDRPALEALLRRGLTGDLLLVTGGVSVGRYDLVREALEDAGVEVLFHRVAIKPGKPILAGRAGECLVLGLPGNPVSAYTGFAVLAAPVLRKRMGRRSWRNAELTVELEAPLRRRPGRRSFHLARIRFEEGRPLAAPVRMSGSGDVLSMTRANAFVVTESDSGDRPAGTRLPAILWTGALPD